jgi:starvation-inducible DNA-binding protein
MSNISNLIARRMAPLSTPSDFSTESVREISGGLSALVADVFALYLKTRTFTGT